MLRIGAFAGSVLVGLAFLVLAQEPQPKGVKEAKNPDASARAAAVRKALAERLEVPDEFRKPTERVPFRIVLAHIAGVLAERKQSLDIAIDSAAFKEAAEGDAIDILESDISFPPFVPTATVQDLLAAALKQIPTNNATYLIRNGRVDILTHEGANIRLLLDQGVAVQFRELPLKLAIEELADRTGVTVMIDPRCGAELNKSVSLQAQNDISPRGILSAWADMFELKLLVDEHRVLLMPRAEYLKNLREQVEEAQLLQQIEKTKILDHPVPEPPVRIRGRGKSVVPAGA
jgi:hypothetical protein